MNIDQQALYCFVGKRLQRQRARLGMTQAELAQQIDLSRTSIANIEAGNQNAPLHVIYELCQILRLKPADLFPSLEEISSPIEVADAIAIEMDGDGSVKGAALVRSLVRSSKGESSGGTGSTI